MSTDHTGPGWWQPPRRRGCGLFAAAVLVSAAVLMAALYPVPGASATAPPSTGAATATAPTPGELP